MTTSRTYLQKGEAMLGGLTAEFPATASMRVSGVDYTHDALITKANTLLAPGQALAALRIQVKEAEGKAKVAEPIVRNWFDELKAALINYYGKGSKDLPGYGITLGLIRFGGQVG